MIPGNLIPIGDVDRPQQRFHAVVWLLLLTNIAVFIYQFTLSESELIRFVYQYGAIAYELTRFEDIPPEINYPIWITPFTSMFMHGGLLHIASNMLYLWIFGDNIEDAFGHIPFLLFYFVCGLAAVATQVIVDPSSQTPVVGASGAIAGILGAYLVLFPRGRVRVVAFLGFIPFFLRLPALIVIGLWIFIQLISGYVSLLPSAASEAAGGVAYFAHIGGFVAGVVITWVTVKKG